MKYQNPILKQLQEYAWNEIIQSANGESISASQLLIKSETLATNLEYEGAKKGDLVLAVKSPGLDFLKIIYATTILEMELVIVEAGKEDYKTKIEEINPQWVFMDYRYLWQLEMGIMKWLFFKLDEKCPDFPIHKHTKVIATGRWIPIFQKHISIKKMRSLERAVFAKPKSKSKNDLAKTSKGLTAKREKSIRTSKKQISFGN